MRRFLLPALSVFLALGCGVPEPRTPGDSYELDFSLPAGSERNGVVLFIVDGLNGEIFQEMLEAGELPGFQEFFVDRGLYVPRAVCNIPGVTLANLTSIATGRFPGHHGVTGINWFDRNQLIWRDYATIAQKNTLDCDYQVPSIYEKFPDRTTFSVFFQPHRNATKFIENWTSAGPMFYFGWYERVDRLTLYRFHIVAEVARSRREFPALVCAYLLAPDFRGYESGASSRSYRDAIRHADFQISRVLKDLRAAGLLDELHIALVSDHGMVDVETHFVLDDFLRCNLGFKLPGRQLWESTAFEDRLAYYRDFDCVTYGSGDRYWAICLRKPLSGPDGPGMADWPVRPGAADLRDYPTPSGRKDLPALLASREEIALVAFRGPAGEIHVQNGAGVVAFAQPAGPGGPIAYRVVQGRDPLGYHAALGETPGPEGIEKTSRQWLKASAGTDYPDLPAQILAYFRARRSGDLCVLAAPGYDFRDEHRGGHGGMLPGEVFVPLLVAGPGIPAGRRVDLGRSVDIFPTILDCMGRAIPEELDGRSLLNLDR